MTTRERRSSSTTEIQERLLVTVSRIAGPSSGLVLGTAESSVPVPDSLSSLLLEAADALARGESVTIVRESGDLTTQEAADLLNVSRPYLVRLLEDGRIPHHKVGTHRRVSRSDALAFREQEAKRRREQIRAIAREAEADGDYGS